MIAAAASEAFSGDSTHSLCAWSNNVLLSGVVLAVIAVAASIFAELYAAAVGFALLGAACFVGWYQLCGGTDAEQLEQSAETLEAGDKILQKTQRQLAALQQQVAAQTSKLTGETAAAKAQLATQTTLNQQLAASNLQLETDKHGLQKQIDSFQSFTTQLKTQLKQFATSSTSLTTTLGDLSPQIASLHQQNETLDTSLDQFRKQVDGDIAALSQLVTVFLTRFEQLSRNCVLFKEELDQIKSTQTKLDSTNTSLQEKTVLMAKLDADITTRTAQLEHLAQAHAEKEKAVAKLEQTKTQLEVLAQKIEAAAKQLEQHRGAHSSSSLSSGSSLSSSSSGTS